MRWVRRRVYCCCWVSDSTDFLFTVAQWMRFHAFYRTVHVFGHFDALVNTLSPRWKLFISIYVNTKECKCSYTHKMQSDEYVLTKINSKTRIFNRFRNYFSFHTCKRSSQSSLGICFPFLNANLTFSHAHFQLTHDFFCQIFDSLCFTFGLFCF